ncbi:MAG: 16S rRNA (cytidine(1402)-2'-O)-methyltransferase [Pseudomonadales bacterium]|nr:16S rRNA (cytidine(1402)-2'-O)-methyltransferase [Pseudomonadales bacterium]NIX06916.1 16S rRNA (cytidine(1402)-2'-O)-methyltransferase [Pseudomonadales bacterium]
MSGVLYVVATPIGNLDDITRRGADVLASVQIVAAEDTRRSQVLLAAIGASPTELISFHAHNEQNVAQRLMSALHEGADVALVSDAGTPLVSDPGFDLIRRCWEEDVRVVPVPGPSSVLAVLSVCPLPAGRFLFEGFLPAKAGQRRERLRHLAGRTEAVVFFEAPHRVADCLSDLERLVPQRRLMVGREMTKRHESLYCGTPEDLREALKGTLRGEFVFVMEAAAGSGLEADAAEVMEILCSELAPAQAARIGARLLKADRAALYKMALERRS